MKTSRHFTNILVIPLLSIAVVAATALIKTNGGLSTSNTPLMSAVLSLREASSAPAKPASALSSPAGALPLPSGSAPAAVAAACGAVSFQPLPDVVAESGGSGNRYRTGDFNGDGFTDVVHIRNFVPGNINNPLTADLIIYLGNGNGGLGAPLIQVNFIPADMSIQTINTGDFNHDGRTDLLLTGVRISRPNNFPVELRYFVLLANASGGFVAPPSTTLADSVTGAGFATVVGDFNNDGNADFVLAGTLRDSPVYVFLGNGQGLFSAPLRMPFQGTPFADDLFTGDFNQDGKLDLIDGRFLALGDGTGQFGTPFDFGIRASSVADFNNDGRLDVLSFMSGTGMVILPGDGAGGFGSPINTGIPLPGEVLDLNKDGNVDLLLGLGRMDDGTLRTFQVRAYLGDGTGHFGITKDFTLLQAPFAIVAQFVTGDFNADGKPDLFVAKQVQSETYSIWLNDTVCANTAPHLSLSPPLTRQRGSASTALVAVVSDAETPAGSLTVLASAPPGITIGPLNNNNGTIFATVGASATAALGDNTVVLTVLDGNGLSAQGTLIVNVTPADNTPTGSNVTVTANNVKVTFGNVATGGNTTITPLDPAAAGALPSGFVLPAGSLAFEVTTTAVFSGPITLTFTVPGVTAAAVFSTLRVLHGEGTPQTLVDRTILAPDTPAPNFATQQISARVTSLSPFVIASLQASGGCSTASFGLATNYGTGTNPASVAVGDFNEDGKADLAVATPGSANVSVLLGSGVGGFSAATNFSADNNPVSVAVGDFNGDGKTDLAVANSFSDNISVLLGNGAGGFGTATNFSVGSFTPISVALGDFNGDGKPDLAVANLGSRNISVLLGNGAGGFNAATNFSVGRNPVSVAVGDFNGDGKADLAVANSSSDNVSVLLGNGAGGFGTATNFSVGSFTPISVALGDFNGDGKTDLVVANASSDNVSVLLGNGTGGFSAATNFNAGSLPAKVAVGDFNGDGKADLAVANSSSANVSVLLGNGTGGFSAATNFSTGTNPQSVAVGDFNGDGKADLAVANSGSANVSVLLNTCTTQTNTAPTITAVAALNRQQGTAGTVSTIAAVSDAETAAGSLTVAATTAPTGITVSNITNTNGTITAHVAAAANAAVGNNTVVLTVTDAGGLRATANLIVNVTASPPPTGCAVMQLQQPLNYATAATPSAVAYGDFNGDGKPDLVTANYEANAVSVLLNNGTGGFHPAVNYNAGSNPKAVSVGDLNGDGKLDLVVANLTSFDLSIFLGKGDGTFTTAPHVSGMSYPTSVASGDFNGDGKADLVVANSGSFLTTVVYGNGDGTFSFGFEQFNFDGGMPYAVTTGDFNKDGRVDFAVAFNTKDAVGVYLNLPSGFVNNIQMFPAGDQPIAIAAGDFDGDGTDDVAVASYGANNVTVVTGISTGGTVTTIAVGNLPESLAVADLNGDAKKDLIVGNAGTNFVSLLTATSGGQFTRRDVVGVESPSAIAATDFNGDGKVDVVVADYWVNRITTYQGGCEGVASLEQRTLRFVPSKYDGYPNVRSGNGRRGDTTRPRSR